MPVHCAGTGDNRALPADLQAKGLLDQTLADPGAEFERTPRINDNDGWDHHNKAFKCLLAGAGSRPSHPQRQLRGDPMAGRSPPGPVHDRPAGGPPGQGTLGRDNEGQRQSKGNDLLLVSPVSRYTRARMIRWRSRTEINWEMLDWKCCQ